MPLDALAAIGQVAGRPVTVEELSTLYSLPAVAVLLPQLYADPAAWDAGLTTGAAGSTVVALLPTILWDYLSASVRRDTKGQSVQRADTTAMATTGQKKSVIRMVMTVRAVFRLNG